MNKNENKAPAQAKVRAEWVRPQLFRMDAADAEANNFTFPDNANGTMMAS